MGEAVSGPGLCRSWFWTFKRGPLFFGQSSAVCMSPALSLLLMSSHCASKGNLLPKRILYFVFPFVTGHSRNWSRSDLGHKPATKWLEVRPDKFVRPEWTPDSLRPVRRKSQIISPSLHQSKRAGERSLPSNNHGSNRQTGVPRDTNATVNNPIS